MKWKMRRGLILVGAIVTLVLAGCSAKSVLTRPGSFEGVDHGTRYAFSFRNDGTYTGKITSDSNITMVEGKFESQSDNDSILMHQKKEVSAEFNSKLEVSKDVPSGISKSDKLKDNGGLLRVKGRNVQYYGVKLHPAHEQIHDLTTFYKKESVAFSKVYQKLASAPFVADKEDYQETLIVFSGRKFSLEYTNQLDGGSIAYADGMTSFNPDTGKLKLKFGTKTPTYHGAIDRTEQNEVDYISKSAFPIAKDSIELNFNGDGNYTLKNSSLKMGTFKASPSSSMTRKQLLALHPDAIAMWATKRTDPENDNNPDSPAVKEENHDFSDLSDDEKINKFRDLAFDDYQDRMSKKNEIVFGDFEFRYMFTSDNGRVVYKLYLKNEDYNSDDVGVDYGYDPDNGDIYLFTLDKENSDSDNQHWQTKKVDSMNCQMPEK